MNETMSEIVILHRSILTSCITTFNVYHFAIFLFSSNPSISPSARPPRKTLSQNGQDIDITWRRRVVHLLLGARL